MMKHIQTILILLALVVFQCSSPFEFEHNNASDQQLVIEGYLTNMGERRHSIRINRTIPVDLMKESEVEYVKYADVKIVDDLGGEFKLDYYKDGLYVTDSSARAISGRSYKLIVKTLEGGYYESSYEKLSASAAFPAKIDFRYDLIEKVLDDEIIQDSMLVISANTEIGAHNRYYRWDIEHYFIIDADRYKDRKLGRAPTPEEELDRADQRFRNCFVRDYKPQSLPLFSALPEEKGVGSQEHVDIHKVILDGRFEQQFVVEAYQLSLSAEAYTYWSSLKGLIENKGGIFDTAPYPVKGNINQKYNDGRDEAPILGYFGVHSATVDRLFISLDELGINDVSYNERCYVSTTLDTCGPGQKCDDPTYWLHPCYDCRSDENYFENYKNKPPKWWKEMFQ